MDDQRQVLDEIVAEPDIRLLLKRLHESFGVRADQAWNLVKRNKVRRYTIDGKTVWTVIGETDEHLIYEAVGYCHCQDFFFKFDTGYICQHIIAQKLAQTKGIFTTVDLNDGEYLQFMKRLRGEEN